MSVGDRAQGTIAGVDFGARWTDFTVEWSGTEMATSARYVRAWPRPDRLPLLVLDRRLVGISRVVVRAAGEEAYLVATGWHHDGDTGESDQINLSTTLILHP